jgi:hypothetical protein
MAPSYRVLALLCTCYFASAQPKAKFLLDIDGPRASPTLRAQRITKEKSIYESYIEKGSGRELFQVRIGDTESQLWRFGITAEGDFNGDGRLDYAWYGGDDTASEHFLFLSCQRGYCGYDISRSFAVAYAREQKTKVPDLAANDYGFSQLTLSRNGRILSISAEIHGLVDKPLSIAVHFRHWLPLKPPDAAYFPAGQATP